MGFLVVDVATVAQGVVGTEGGCHASGGGNGVTPGIVGVLDNRRAGAVQNGDHVTLQVRHVVICSAVVYDLQRCAGGVITEVQFVAAQRHVGQLVPIVNVGISVCAVRPLGS